MSEARRREKARALMLIAPLLIFVLVSGRTTTTRWPRIRGTHSSLRSTGT